MPTTTEQLLTVLRSIDTTLKRIELSQKRPTMAPPSDLDSKYGDPKVTFLPRDWSGDNYKGRLFSECPPELLDLVAASLDWLGTKAEENDERTSRGKPVADYKRLDAARARGWAQRKREGWVPPTQEADPLLDNDDPEIDPFGGTDDMPF